jgi:acyl-lipid omega-6 desaturase (Delta-12 desaturase)
MFESTPDMVQSPPEARALVRLLARYREPDSARAVFELTITAVPFFVIWALMWIVLVRGHWIGLLLAAPAAGLLVRLFMIQHDCGHGSFFRGRLTNDWVGRIIGVVTLTPYDYWRRNHALHHASSGNLDRRGFGDIDTLTVREFLARPRWRQILYRLYRHPIVMFGIGPTYLFILRHRLPIGMMRSGWKPWLSAIGTNTAIAILVAAMIWVVGFGPFLLVHLPITVLAASIGVWLFYIQHQFEDTSWSHDESWRHHEAALHGSSYYHLPGVLRWFTANIGVHHVHHLCSRIPCYRLPDVLRDHPQLAAVGRITLLQSLQCVPLALWDEKAQRLVSFEQADMGRFGPSGRRLPTSDPPGRSAISPRDSPIAG